MTAEGVLREFPVLDMDIIENEQVDNLMIVRFIRDNALRLAEIER